MQIVKAKCPRCETENNAYYGDVIAHRNRLKCKNCGYEIKLRRTSGGRDHPAYYRDENGALRRRKQADK